MKYHMQGHKESRSLPARPVNPLTVHDVHKKVIHPFPVLDPDLLSAWSTAVAADQADRQVTDLHVHAEGR